MRIPNYDKFPFVQVPGGEDDCVQGWDDIAARLRQSIARRTAKKTVVVVECYTGVDELLILREIQSRLAPVLTLRATEAMLAPEEVDMRVAPFLGGEDPVFGFLSGLTLPQFFSDEKLGQLRAQNSRVAQDLAQEKGLCRVREPKLERSRGQPSLGNRQGILLHQDLPAERHRDG